MKHGGSCIYVKSSIDARPYTQFEHLNQEEHFESSMVELTKLNMIIICVYRTPSSDIKILTDNLDVIISSLINKYKYILVVGDLNVDFLSNKVNGYLQTVLNYFNLEAIIDVPTRVTDTSKTAVDQIIYIIKIKCGCMSG